MWTILPDSIPFHLKKLLSNLFLFPHLFFFLYFLNLISCIIFKTLARNKNDIHLYYPDPQMVQPDKLLYT